MEGASTGSRATWGGTSLGPCPWGMTGTQSRGDTSSRGNQLTSPGADGVPCFLHEAEGSTSAARVTQVTRVTRVTRGQMPGKAGGCLSGEGADSRPGKGGSRGCRAETGAAWGQRQPTVCRVLFVFSRLRLLGSGESTGRVQPTRGLCQRSDTGKLGQRWGECRQDPRSSGGRRTWRWPGTDHMGLPNPWGSVRPWGQRGRRVKTGDQRVRAGFMEQAESLESVTRGLNRSRTKSVSPGTEPNTGAASMSSQASAGQ